MRTKDNRMFKHFKHEKWCQLRRFVNMTILILQKCNFHARQFFVCPRPGLNKKSPIYAIRTIYAFPSQQQHELAGNPNLSTTKIYNSMNYRTLEI